MPTPTGFSTQAIPQFNTTVSVEADLQKVLTPSPVKTFSSPVTSGAPPSLPPHSQGSSAAFNNATTQAANPSHSFTNHFVDDGRANHSTSNASHPLQPPSYVAPIQQTHVHNGGYAQQGHPPMLPSHTWAAAYRVPGPPAGNGIPGPSTLRLDHNYHNAPSQGALWRSSYNPAPGPAYTPNFQYNFHDSGLAPGPTQYDASHTMPSSFPLTFTQHGAYTGAPRTTQGGDFTPK